MDRNIKRTPWEEAVLDYCNQPNNSQALLDNYFDENVVEAAERFSNSIEFAETLKLIPESARNILEIGAGRGIASYAFAKRGFNVTALEPDTGSFIGSSAIKQLAQKTSTNIHIVEDFGEGLPFHNESFDVVYIRQALHHAKDLDQFCSEAARVLAKNGIFIAVREHVIDKPGDLNIFLESHPLHHRYGGENAFTVHQYKNALRNSGLKAITVLTTFDSDINLYPSSKESVKENIKRKLKFRKPDIVFDLILKGYGITNKTPGRLYSFIGSKL
jgi:ubiquinone/menaquinone biosynthesis C-methylase UbiE